MREKKTSMHFGSLLMSFKSIIDIIKKVPSLVSFIVSIAMTHLGWKAILFGLINEVKKWGEY